MTLSYRGRITSFSAGPTGLVIEIEADGDDDLRKVLFGDPAVPPPAGVVQYPGAAKTLLPPVGCSWRGYLEWLRKQSRLRAPVGLASRRRAR